MLPRESVTVIACETVSLHPTITTFRFPAVCAPANGTTTVVCGDCGTAEFLCTNAGAVGGLGVTAVATFEYAPRFPAASVARTR